MNELTTTTKQLPGTLPELSKFALVGREKLKAVKAEISAIKKVGLAKDVLQQKKEEAQEIAEMVTLSEVQIGKILKAIPKSQGARTDTYTSSLHDEEVKTKTAVIGELGFNRNQVSEFQRMADNEQAVRKAMAKARENDDIISRSAVLQEIKNKTKPHVSNNSGDNEWYTPAEYIEAARSVMGSIDLDPASNDYANQTIKATKYYTKETDGLSKEWGGNIWMNPPYSTNLVGKFAEKLSQSAFNQAIVLVNNATDTAWFKTMIEKADAIVFTTGRVRFIKGDGAKGAPLQGQAFIYFGNNAERFMKIFKKYGWGAYL